MATSNRAALINKMIKVVNKHYKSTPVPKDRTLFENLLYACCLENSLHESAELVFEKLTRDYFDWNEVRVSTVRELSEVTKPLNDPEASATRLKRVLQSIFETHYSFDLEALKKQNIGQAVKALDNYRGTTPFIVSYVTQNSLSGHSIPVNQGLLESVRIVEIISDAEANKGTIPGLERTIPKSKGVDIGALLHQLGVELHRKPYGPTIRNILQEIAPECKSRLPKRPVKKKAATTKPKSSKSSPPDKKSATKKLTETKRAKSQVQKKAATKKKQAVKKPGTKTTSTSPKKKLVKKKKVLKKGTKKKVVKKKSRLTATKRKHKAPNKRLAKRKPR
ncbi:MAG: hypothetical protein ABGX16_10855 [Pirellulales bacterium]